MQGGSKSAHAESDESDRLEVDAIASVFDGTDLISKNYFAGAQAIHNTVAATRDGSIASVGTFPAPNLHLRGHLWTVLAVPTVFNLLCW
jgi:hypothetical protein